MPRALKALLLGAAALASFIVFWLGCFVLSWLVLPLTQLPLRRRSVAARIGRCQDVVGCAFRVFISFMRLLGLIEFHPRKLELPSPPFVMIANHPTLIDVALLMGLYPRICCVVKADLFRSRVAGRLLRYCGHIEGGDADPLRGGAVIQAALLRCESGQSVLMFPEGTRSPKYGVKRFRPGVFEISLRGGVPIVPILITCEPPTLTKDLPWYGLPKTVAVYDLVQLPTVPTGHYGSDSRAMAGRFQALFQSRIDAWKSGLGNSSAPRVN